MQVVYPGLSGVQGKPSAQRIELIAAALGAAQVPDAARDGVVFYFYAVDARVYTLKPQILEVYASRIGRCGAGFRILKRECHVAERDLVDVHIRYPERLFERVGQGHYIEYAVDVVAGAFFYEVETTVLQEDAVDAETAHQKVRRRYGDGQFLY